jgi:hypothetical protein
MVSVYCLATIYRASGVGKADRYDDDDDDDDDDYNFYSLKIEDNALYTYIITPLTDDNKESKADDSNSILKKGRRCVCVSVCVYVCVCMCVRVISCVYMSMHMCE